MSRKVTKDLIGLTEKDSGVLETLFHNANGYIGIRGCLEEGVPDGWDTMRGMYINGFFDVVPMKQAESLCNLVEEKQTIINIGDTQTIKLKINGQPFSIESGSILEHQKVLDMEEGITRRAIRWKSPNNEEVEIIITRFASFYETSLFAMKYEVKAVDFSGEIQISSLHIPEVRNYCNPKDPRMAAESEQYIHSEKIEVLDERSYSLANTSQSNLSVAIGVGHENLGGDTYTIEENGGTVKYTLIAPVEKGKSVSLIKYTIVTDSIRVEDPLRRAKEKMCEVLNTGFDYYIDEQKKYMTEYWASCAINIEGNDNLKDSVNYNMYQLLQSVTKDEYGNIAAKGLSGEGYEGHYFWDTEMFMIPFFCLSKPELAKNLLKYRHTILESARENAGLLGHKKGVLFPWRTISGKECSGYYPSGTAQYHINGDIAYAIVQYYLATDDMEFLAQYGGEILIETARLWLDVGNYDGEQFVINCVTGPDEYTCMVNNNYFTNCSAKYNLEWANKVYQLLNENKMSKGIITTTGITKAELEKMKKAADNMYLPYDESLGINPQDDSFLKKPVWDFENTDVEKYPLLLHYHPLHLYRYQVCKQADTILAYQLYDNYQSRETMKNSFRYYEKITTHDSSLSTSTFSVVASQLGDIENAYEYFGDSAKLDLENTHNNTKDGMHTANMGGCYMAIVNGFAGVKIKEDGIHFAPKLPEAWKEYSIRFCYRNNLIKLKVIKDRSEFSLLKGNGVKITVNGQSHQLMKSGVIID